MARTKQNLTKITTNIHTPVLECLDRYAADKGLTRTTALTILLSQRLFELDYVEKCEVPSSEGSRG